MDAWVKSARVMVDEKLRGGKLPRGEAEGLLSVANVIHSNH